MELVIGTAGDRDFAVDAQALVTGRTCIIAQSGAGKSWGVAVLCERLCQAHVGFCLIDTEGEYFSLKDRFQVLWVGTDEHCDEDIENVDIIEVMSRAVRGNIPVIFDVSETDMQERVEKLVTALYEIESDLRKPYLLIIEEADKFIPQSKHSIKKIEEISRRGRKRGLGMLVATQRPSLVTKNVLSQCNNQIIGKLSIENDLKAVDLFFSSRSELEELAELDPGEFYVMGGLARTKTRMRFGRRETEHRGLTPQLVPGHAVVINGIKPPAPAPAGTGSPQDAGEAEPAPEIPVPKGPADALPPVIGREEALVIAQWQRKKKVLGFGHEERIADVELVLWPLVHIEVKYLAGVLKKTTKTTSFLIDGVSGGCADPGNGLKVRPCFNALLGLDEDAVRLLGVLTPAGATEAEMEASAKLTRAAVRKALRQLAERKLVTEAGTAGKAKIYVPLLPHKMPKLGLKRFNTVALTLAPRTGTLRKRTIDEKEIRTILKGLEPTAEIVRFEDLYYPVYEISFVSGQGERLLHIDGITGREIAPLTGA
jgi:hypothetical protein